MAHVSPLIADTCAATDVVPGNADTKHRLNDCIQISTLKYVHFSAIPRLTKPPTSHTHTNPYLAWCASPTKESPMGPQRAASQSAPSLPSSHYSSATTRDSPIGVENLMIGSRFPTTARKVASCFELATSSVMIRLWRREGRKAGGWLPCFMQHPRRARKADGVGYSGGAIACSPILPDSRAKPGQLRLLQEAHR